MTEKKLTKKEKERIRDKFSWAPGDVVVLNRPKKKEKNSDRNKA